MIHTIDCHVLMAAGMSPSIAVSYVVRDEQGDKQALATIEGAHALRLLAKTRRLKIIPSRPASGGEL